MIREINVDFRQKCPPTKSPALCFRYIHGRAVEPPAGRGNRSRFGFKGLGEDQWQLVGGYRLEVEPTQAASNKLDDNNADDLNGPLLRFVTHTFT